MASRSVFFVLFYIYVYKHEKKKVCNAQQVMLYSPFNAVFFLIH